ncbi:cinnamycin family lantibiotic [Actinoallomurus soli]|uniref:cinnamycin family lantibiotic n=1 Tax=Actinoallomurus soli TaxID=2952535 RepID=UPI00209232D3|nr:cinnamycin family lantibiotic [Actinoallomurus soli]MCO5967656.1 cinnamycin family lantibiotic [Actinoallomurus soli]
MTIQAVVDDEFRAQLMADPTAFGAGIGSLPDPIEQSGRESLEFWVKGDAGEIYACPSTHHCNHTYACHPTY